MKREIKITLIAILILIFLFIAIRTINPKEIDDVTPEITCEKNILKKADILWVVPKFNNIPISSNQTWCKEILALNKTLGLHGITHQYKEFENQNTTQEQLKEAIKIFEDCFNQTPTLFKPPQITISEQNKQLIEANNLTLKTRFNQITRKVYHCDDTGIFPNWFIDLI